MLHLIIAVLTVIVTVAILHCYFRQAHRSEHRKILQAFHEDDQSDDKDVRSDKKQDLTTKERIEKYISDPQLQDTYKKLRTGAESIVERASVLTEIERDSSLLARFPDVAKSLGKVAKLSNNIIPAGRALGVFVDMACEFGFIDKNSELRKMHDEMNGVKEEVHNGFEELKTIIDQQRFLQLHEKWQAKVQVFKQNLNSGEHLFYERIGRMVMEYSPDEIISDLKQMHNIITGQSTFDSTPLFIKLARCGNTLEGEKFDKFMVKILLQFQSTMVLQIDVVRMLRSFLAYNEQDAIFASDVEGIFKDLACQLSHHDPVAYYDWYIRFKLYGGTFSLSTVKWKDRYIYMQKTHWGNVKGLDGHHPGDQGVFIIKPHYEGDTYIISPVMWQNWRMYMQQDLEGDVCGCEGNPGEQGHWRFTLKKFNESAEESSFLVSTAKWPTWNMYMRDNAFKNVRGFNGDPGDQGHFIMTRTDIVLNNY